MEGLTSAEAAKLLKQHGPNLIREQKKRTLLKIFFEQFQNVLTILLLVAASVAFVLGEYIDSQLILIIVILNAVFGVYQEKKAEQAIAALRNMTKEMVRVIRDGKEIEISSTMLVPGDIVYLEEGMKVPADGIVVEGNTIEANEAGLTGESLPVAKKESDEMYAGTIVSKGRGRIRVTQTGMRTKFGEIAAKLSEIDKSKTLLERKLEGFTKLLGAFGIGSSIIVTVLSFMQGQPLVSSLLLGTSLAVAVVPEGLTAVMTITMALGVREMAKRKAILRKLTAIEALGSVSLIATDKTGTLTKNSMRVIRIWADGQTAMVDAKYKPHSETVQTIIRNGLICSTASLEETKKGDYKILGDPTEGALLIFGDELNTDYKKVRAQVKVLKEVPFDSVHKRMSVTVEDDGKEITYSKGAVESILRITHHIRLNDRTVRLDITRRKIIDQLMEEWAKEGLRVLGFAQDDVLLGMVALHDPPREEAHLAIQRAVEAGIRVVMVTGDNPITGGAIAKQIGLLHDGELVVTGADIEKLTDKQLMKQMPQIRVYARVSPLQKSRLVGLYQKMGHVVAVTGDGVNDAVALKQADVGIAMGKVGTDVARETADMVITDDNFATIINAIEEGRNIIKNIRNSIKYLLTGNICEALVIIAGIIMGYPTLFTAVQLLYINLLSDGIPSIVMAFSPREKNAMKRPPEKEVKLLMPFDVRYILTLGVAGSILVLSTFFTLPISEELRRSVLFAVLALVQPFYLFNLWVTHQSYREHWKEFMNPLFLGSFLYPFVFMAIVLQLPFTTELFKIERMPVWMFFLCVGYASITLITVWVFVKLFRHERFLPHHHREPINHAQPS